MDQVEFQERFKKDMIIYNEWGHFVTNTIVDKLSNQVNIQEFLKVKPIPRVKDMNSLIEKAFYRNKNYKDPYQEITDKVGTRFIVLLVEDIHIIKNIIESLSDIWNYSLDRDFEAERLAKPYFFDYQSVHYIVRNKKEVAINSIIIPPNTPCEIQIRTLVQHAYSELTHNTVYKSKKGLPNDAIRLIARSMALIEATDELFSNVNGVIKKMNAESKEFINNLNALYSEFFVPQGIENLNLYIFDSIKDITSNIDLEKTRVFLNENKYIIDSIKKQYPNNLLFRQPIILLLYYLISVKRRALLKYWPLSEDELKPLFSDLGISMTH